MSADLEARAFKRRGGALYPADFAADEYLSGIGEGRIVLVTARKARNPRHHSLLFAILRKVVDNTDRWADEAVLLDDLKLATGLFTTRVSAITGMPYPVPASISFASMDQIRFAAWFEKAVQVLARDVLGAVPETLRAEIEEMVASDSGRIA